MQDTRCVLLFSRAPAREGQVKRVPEARPLFELSRRRVAEAVRALPGVGLVLIGDGPSLPGVPALPQRGRDFAERLKNAFADVGALGFTEILVVPADVPALSTGDLAAAFAALGPGNVVLGPSPDGGVYLIGVREDPTPFLDGVRWLTPHVAEDLTRRVESSGRRVVLLAPRRDVDRRRDLVSLRNEPGLDAAVRQLVARLLSTPAPVPAPVRWLAGVPAPLTACAPRAPPAV